MKFLGEWIPQKSSKRKIKGFIDLSQEYGYENDVKFFEIKKNGTHKIWGSKVSRSNNLVRGSLEHRNTAKASKLDGWNKRTSLANFMHDMSGLNESFGYSLEDGDCNIIFYPKEQFSRPQKVYSQHSYWTADVYSVSQLSNVYPTDSVFSALADVFDSGSNVPTGQITFFASTPGSC